MQPIRCHVVATREVVTDYAKVVNAHMRELRTSRYFADRPNAGRSRLQPFVDLEITMIGQFNAGRFQSEVLRVWPPSRCDHQMGAHENLFLARFVRKRRPRNRRISRKSVSPVRSRRCRCPDVLE